ncbi:MAG: ABC transporter ATP-binding protein [Caldisericia bacterium]
MEKKTILNTENIEMRFGGLYALKNVNINVYENEILGMIGPNGSGKTTFFNVITGFYKPTGGNFYFLGERLTGNEPYEIMVRGISRTYQTSRVCFDLTVLDNILIGTHFVQKSRYFDALINRKKLYKEVEFYKEKAVHLLKIFNPELVNKLYVRVGSLPFIDRRRVEISRAMISEPKLILLDEPSAGMNADETMELMDDIRKVRSEMKNVTIFIIEHDMKVISTVTERVYALNFGQVIAEGTYEEVSNNIDVKEAYFGKELNNENRFAA